MKEPPEFLSPEAKERIHVAKNLAQADEIDRTFKGDRVIPDDLALADRLDGLNLRLGKLFGNLRHGLRGAGGCPALGERDRLAGAIARMGIRDRPASRECWTRQGHRAGFPILRRIARVLARAAVDARCTVGLWATIGARPAGAGRGRRVLG